MDGADSLIVTVTVALAVTGQSSEGVWVVLPCVAMHDTSRRH